MQCGRAVPKPSVDVDFFSEQGLDASRKIVADGVSQSHIVRAGDTREPCTASQMHAVLRRLSHHIAGAGEPAATQPLPDIDDASGLASTDKMPDIYTDGNRDRRRPTRDAELTTTQPLGYDEAPSTVRPDKPQRGGESKRADRPSDGILLHETTVVAEPGGKPGSDLRATQVLPDLTLGSAGDRSDTHRDLSAGSSEEDRVAVSSPREGKAAAPPDRPETFPPRGSRAGNRSQRTRRTLASDKDLLAEIEELIGRRLDSESR